MLTRTTACHVLLPLNNAHCKRRHVKFERFFGYTDDYGGGFALCTIHIWYMVELAANLP